MTFNSPSSKRLVMQSDLSKKKDDSQSLMHEAYKDKVIQVRCLVVHDPSSMRPLKAK